MLRSLLVARKIGRRPHHSTNGEKRSACDAEICIKIAVDTLFGTARTVGNHKTAVNSYSIVTVDTIVVGRIGIESATIYNNAAPRIKRIICCININIGIATHNYIVFRFKSLATCTLAKDKNLQFATVNGYYAVAFDTFGRRVSIGQCGMLNIFAIISDKQQSAIHLHFAIAVYTLSGSGTILEVEVTTGHIHGLSAFDAGIRTVISLFGRECNITLCQHRQRTINDVDRAFGIESARCVALCLYRYVTVIHIDICRLNAIAFLAH